MIALLWSLEKKQPPRKRHLSKRQKVAVGILSDMLTEEGDVSEDEDEEFENDWFEYLS